MTTTQPEQGSDAPPGPGTVYERFQASDDFQTLRHRYRGFAFPMAAAFLGWYLLFVLCSSYAPELMGKKLIGNINVAFVFGILQFVTTFTIAWLYSRHANGRLDPLADQLKHRIERELP
jgi:uncharacterized membrane protein (DUF485 family)